MKDQLSSLRDSIKDSPFSRVLLIGFLILLLQIPILMIDGIIGERKTRRDEAREEIVSKWGREQTIIGPILTVPYISRRIELDKYGKQVLHKEVRYTNFLPETLKIDGVIRSAVNSVVQIQVSMFHSKQR